jgi:hypothetical protein
LNLPKLSAKKTVNPSQVHNIYDDTIDNESIPDENDQYDYTEGDPAMMNMAPSLSNLNQ